MEYLGLLKDYSWVEIEAFCIRQQIDLSPWESTTLFLMGDAYAAMLSKAYDRNCPSPMEDYQTEESQLAQEEREAEQVSGAFASLRSIAKASATTNARISN